MNARETRFLLANDLEIKDLKKIEMNVANSHQKGGSSAGRFDRIFENKRDRNNTYQVETILKLYYDFQVHRPNVLGFIIGGAAETRSRVFGDEDLDVLKDYIVTNIPYLGSDPYKLYRETEQARIDYEKNSIKKKVSEIEELLEKSPDLLCFGLKEIGYMASQHMLKKCYVSSSKLREVSLFINSTPSSNSSSSTSSTSTSISKSTGKNKRNKEEADENCKNKDKIIEIIEITNDSLEKWGSCVGILKKADYISDDSEENIDKSINDSKESTENLFESDF